MKKDLKTKLKSYSMAAGAVLSAGATKAQVVYTDINPDQTFSTNNAFYLLDLNNDNIDDFQIEMIKSAFTFTSFQLSFFRAHVTPMGSNEVAASSSYYALALAANDQINNTLSWTNTSSALMGAKFYVNTSFTSYSSSYGNWVNAADKYLGLKLQVGANTHYGWARLDVNTSSGSFTIKDYAYDGTPNASILAGVVPADPATAVAGTDVGEASNGTDLQVDFTKVANEATITDYRIMVVKNSSAGSFDLTTAQAVAASDYTIVAPTGSNISTTLAANATDTDGDPISIGVAYRVFVLSTPDGVIRTSESLSQPSSPVTLNTTAPKASSLVATDVSNNHDVTDLEIAFNRGAIESQVAEYRVIVLKSTDVALFNLAAAEAVVAGNYESILPTGSNIQQVLTNTTKDKDGFSIVEAIPYTCFVLSMSNGTTSNINSLSDPSNEITLSPTTGISDQLKASVKVYGNGQIIHTDLGSFNGNVHMTLTDVSGRTVLRKQLSTGQEQTSVSVEPGVYLVRLSLNDEIIVNRIHLN